MNLRRLVGTGLGLALLAPTILRADYDEALEAYRRAVSLNPQLVQTIQNQDIRRQLRADFLEQARDARKAGQLPEAERNFLLAGNFGEDFELFQELGAVYMEMEAWSKAVVVYKKAVGAKPSDVEAMGELARAYHRAGQPQLAARFYARAISMDPAVLPKLKISPVLARKVRAEMIARARMLAKKNMPVDAAAKFDLALGLGDSAELRLEQAKQYKAAGDDDAAARAYALAVDLDAGLEEEMPPEYKTEAARFLYVQGAKAFQRKDLERARHLFDRSISLKPSGRTFYNLGNVHVHGGKLDAAIGFYQKAAELDPELDEARLNMAMVQIEKGLYSRAIRDLKELVSHSPGRSEAYDLIAQAYTLLSKPGKALKVYQAAVNFDAALAGKLEHGEVKRGASLAFFEEAREAFAGKDFREALELCEKSLALDVSPRAHYMIGNAKFALDDPHGAIEAYNEALELTPEHAPTLNNLGNAYLKLKDYPKAVQAFRRATEVKTDYAQAFNNLGIALRKAGKLKDAIRAYKKALEIDPNYAAAYFNLGNAYQVQGG